MRRYVRIPSLCMTSHARLRLLLPVALIFAGALPDPAAAQSQAGAPSVSQGSRNVQVKALPNGIQLSAHGTILQITALRDDVLRVRAADNGRLPEDASWAVLPAARTASVPTVPEITAGRMGFHTTSLRITCDAQLHRPIRKSSSAGHPPNRMARSCLPHLQTEIRRLPLLRPWRQARSA
jgi:hypothetical protein